MALFFFVLLFSSAKTEEVATPSSLLGPRDFNHHSFAAKYLQELRIPETTKQGPVVFPNDAPPPPRPPLIVTSRPLLESISRSELNPLPQNGTVPQQSQSSTILKPFLARVKDYKPFAYAIAAPPQDYDDRYDDYEHQKPLPPIYKVLADHAKQKVVKIQEQRHKDRYEYQVKGPEYYHHHHTNNDLDNHDSRDAVDDQGKNYAFSYRVKDQKTGDDFSHRQHSSGSATNGEYRVRLPDGRMQIVSYTADENGYQADVRYDDEDKTAGNSIGHHKKENYNNYNTHQYNDINNKVNYHNDNYDNNQITDHHNFDDNDVYDRNNFDYKLNNYDKNNYEHEYAQQRDYKVDVNEKYKTPVNSDYYNQYSDVSKEYYNDDLSKEYESKSYDYAPHKSKYSAFIDDKNTNIEAVTPSFRAVSTVKPSYEELKDLLVTKKAYNTVQPSFFTKIPVSINVPSTTPSSLNYNPTTERVVVIGGKKTNFYTNIRNVPLVSTAPIPVTQSPIRYVTGSDFSVSSTPMSYLESTIASLRNNVDLSGHKPVLSNSYIDRINKYLRFNK